MTSRKNKSTKKKLKTRVPNGTKKPKKEKELIQFYIPDIGGYSYIYFYVDLNCFKYNSRF